MKAYMVKINGMFNAIHPTKEGCETQVRQLNQVFQRRRNQYGLNFDVRFATMHEVHVSEEAPQPKLDTYVRWVVVYERAVNGTFEEVIKDCYVYDTREEARKCVRHLKDHPELFRNYSIIRQEHVMVKSEVVR